MTLEIAVLFFIIIVMVLLMASEKLSPDTLSISLMMVLIVGGFVSPAEGLAGFSNQATITILILMMLTVGLETTGVITAIGKRIKVLLIGEEWKTLTILMLIVGTCSAFISTTAVVIVFMRILIKLSKTLPTSLSRLLMPLSFAGILGGSCTLLGTSTNLLVSSIAKDAGLAPFGVFEFLSIGAFLFVAGVLYMVFIGRFLIPNRKKNEELGEEYHITDYLSELVVSSQSNLVDQRVDATDFFTDEAIDLIEIKRSNDVIFPDELQVFKANDVLLVKCSVEKLAKIREKGNLTLASHQSSMNDERLNTSDMTLCEVFIKPNSKLVGKYIDKVEIKRLYNAIPLAIKKNSNYYSSNFESLKIDAGDTLLMEVGRLNFKNFYNRPDLVVLQEHEALAAKSNKRYLAAFITIMVILTAALHILPILQSALLGCVAMILSGCMDLQRAYRRIDWGIFILLAGIIPLGTAMENTGASQLIADTFLKTFGHVSPSILVAVLFLITMLLSAVISNNAAAILFAPIAISIALDLNLDPRPLLLTIMLAANMSFMSPIGYQTNTLIYNVGEYRFVDFFRVGGLLSIIIWLLVSLIIPYLYF
jgi:di/tricarboxylate transporter